MKDKARFIKQYNQLINQLNRDHQSLLWWATDLSSKNRYTCSFPDQVAALIEGQPFQLKKTWELRFSRFKKIAALFWMAGMVLIRSILSKIILGRRIKKLLSEKYELYVIKTFVYDSSFDDKGVYHDSFFGRLPQDIATQKPTVMLVNALGSFRHFLIKAKQQDAHLIPFEFFLNPNDIIQALWDVLRYRIILRNPVYIDGIDVTGTLELELYRNFQGIQIQQFVHYASAKNLLRQAKVKTFLMTFENNPWERMCTLAIRQTSPTTKILGYQHAIIPEAALNMMLDANDVGLVPLPDKILTVGEITANFLTSVGQYPNNMVEPAAALRYEYLNQLTDVQYSAEGNILVVLDGVRQTAQLLEYIINQTKKLKGFHPIVIRAHPALPISYWKQKYNDQIEKNPLLTWSSQSLNKDLQEACIVVYWQSTVAWEALAMGKSVISFDAQELLSFDPLFGLSLPIPKVKTHDSLVEAVNKIKTLSFEQKQLQYRQAMALMARYFYPVSEQSFRKFL